MLRLTSSFGSRMPTFFTPSCFTPTGMKDLATIASASSVRNASSKPGLPSSVSISVKPPKYRMSFLASSVAVGTPGPLVRMPNTILMSSSRSSRCAPLTANSGLDCASSDTREKVYFLPLTVMPPRLLSSSNAIATPSLAGRSKLECGPVRLLTMPTLTTCVYRKLKSDHSGGEVRPEWRVNE